MKIIGVLITLITGLLFLIGVIVIKKSRNKENVYKFSSALAFSVIIGLIFFDLLPEILESFGGRGTNKQIIYILGFTLIGIIVLKLLDCLVPVHNHDHHEKNDNHSEHNAHLYHISVVTSIALIIHNMIEGMAIYTIGSTNIKLGILMGVGVGLHNIPMGMEIAASLDMSHQDKLTKVLIYLLLVVSPLFGAIVILFNQHISDVVLGVLMCLTCGMLIYISIFELLNEVKHNIKSKITIAGLIIGIGLMLISFII